MSLARLIGIALILLAPTVHVAVAQAASAVTLRVVVRGLESNAGSIAYALFDSRTSYDEGERPYRAGFAPIAERQSRVILPSLPPGDYALRLFHDRNGNEQIDLGAFRIPTEPYGFSNDARGSFGPPSFERARFRIADDPTVIEITVR